MDYFDLLKGSTGPRDDKELTFGDLLSECRESAKERVDESKQVSEQDYKEDNEELNKDKTPDMGDPSKDPDSDVPPPPDEVKDNDTPMEMRKEYLGKSDETHYYFITTEGGAGDIDDLVITDQDGTKKYSAKEQDMEITEEGIAEFLQAAIRDVPIDSIQRSPYLKYIYPKQIEEEPEMPLEDEEEKLPEEPKVEKAPEEAKPPRESVVHETKVDEAIDLSKLGDDELVAKYEEQLAKDSSSELVAEMAKLIKERGLEINESKESGRLIEMKVTDDKENTFDVYLMDNDEEGTTIGINGLEHTFSEYSDYFRDEEGKLTKEGLKELALDVLANLVEEEYNELAARAGEEESNEEAAESDDVYTNNPQIEGKNNPSVRDGTGPAKGSAQKSISDKGRRKEAGEECLVKENIKGNDNMLDEKKTPEELHQEASKLEAKARELHKEAEDLKLKQLKKAKESKEINKGNDNMLDEKKTVIALLHDAEKAEQKAKNLRKEADELKKAERAAEKAACIIVAKVKKESVKPGKPKKKVKENEQEHEVHHVSFDISGLDIENGVELDPGLIHRILSIAFEEDDTLDANLSSVIIDDGLEEEPEVPVESKSKITETDVSKGTKALIKLAKEAAKESDYAKAAEHYTKLAEIEAMVPAEAEAEAEKPENAEPEKEEPEAPEESAEEPETPMEDDLEVEESAEVAVEEEVADEKKAKPTCKKCGKKHWPFEKCAAAKKESKIKVESTQDINETKQVERLKELLNM